MIRLLVLTFIFVGCASKQKHFAINQAELDSLRSESLYRHTQQRLAQLPDQGELIMCHQGKIDEALKKFEQQLDQRSKDPLYWSHIGTCYYLKAEYPKAKFYYQLALGLTKNKEVSASLYNNMGLIFLKVKKYEEAHQHFQHALKLTPNSMTPHYNITQIYIQHRHYTKAQDELSKLLVRAPLDVDFNYWQAHVYLMTGKYQEAQKQFTRIPNEYLRRQDIANNYAMLLYLMGNYKAASEALNNGDRSGPLHVLQARVEIEKKLRDKIN